jgi:glycosyltransferase involved in cell wall biosynthesis
VAARAGAVPDVVPETAGILVPADNAEALADALQHLLTSPADYQALRRGAQAAAAALPAWQDTATRILQVMNAVSARS